MSTAGTLYDETVKNGFAKLLSAQTVTNVSAVDFVAPLAFALGYRTFWFDFYNLVCNTNNDRFVANVSWDGGTSWGPDFLWSFIRCYSHQAADTYGSVALSPSAAGGVYRGVMWLGHDQAANLYISGRLYFHRGVQGASGYRGCYGEMTGRHPSAGVSIISHAQFSWFSPADFNAIRFYFTGSTMSGTIRCYGLKTGSN
jgi:hypothetical protein